jgi:uncharacterized protein (DUF1778 family)
MEEKILSDEFIGIRVQPDIRKLIEDRASEEGLTISEYLRYTVMLDSVYAGRSEAYKILSRGFSRAFVEWFKGRLKEIKKLNITL